MPYLTTDGDLNQAKRKRAGEALAIDAVPKQLSAEAANTPPVLGAPGNPFAPTVFVKDQDMACWSNEFNSAFSPNTSGWVVSTQAQSNPAWYSLPTTPKWVATTRGVAPVVPRFLVNTVLTAEAI